MSIATTIPQDAHWVVLNDLTWEDYQDLLRIRGDRPRPRILYLDGSVWLVSPSRYHERLTARMRWVAEQAGKALEIDFQMSGSMTFGRQEGRGGAEADASFYVTHLEAVAVPPADPAGEPTPEPAPGLPPDLVIETVLTNPVDPSLQTYRRLEVPEVWVYRKGTFRILHFGEGRYVDAERSLAFPPLAAADVQELVDRPIATDVPWLRALDDWIRDVLLPRREGP